MIRPHPRQHLEGRRVVVGADPVAGGAELVRMSFSHSSVVWCWMMNSISSWSDDADAARRGAYRARGSRHSSSAAAEVDMRALVRGRGASGRAPSGGGPGIAFGVHVTALRRLNVGSSHAFVSSTSARPVTASNRSTYRRYSGARPKRRTSGARSRRSPRADQCLHHRIALRGRKLTWLPRARLSRLTEISSCAAQRFDETDEQIGEAQDFSRTASRSHSSNRSTPTSSAASDRMGGVPRRHRDDAGRGRYAPSKANGSAWPSQPDSGCAKHVRAGGARRRTRTPARRAAVQVLVAAAHRESAPAPRTSSGIAPAE